MIWFESVHIENYESHKNTYIEFSPGINEIIGESDAGKSGIQRSIRWACYNEPSGDGFIRRDADYIQAELDGKKPKVICTVTLKLSNGYTIVRSKGLGVNLNRYCLIDSEGSELEFNNFGLEVPDEIKDALGFRHLTVDKQKLEVNYIPQMESPLAWAYQGAGLARLLNKFNNIDDFENLSKRINKRVHARGDIVTEIKVLQTNIDEKNKELSTLTDPSDAIQCAEDLLKDLEVISENENRVNTAKRLLKDCEDIKIKHQIIEEKTKSVDSILVFKDSIEKLSEMADKVRKAKAILSNADTLRTKLTDLQEKLDNITPLTSIDIENLIVLSDKIKKSKDLLTNAQNIVSNINDNQRQLQEISAKMEALSGSVEEQTRIIVEDLQICPYCEQNLTADSAEKVIRSMSK